VVWKKEKKNREFLRISERIHLYLTRPWMEGRKTTRGVIPRTSARILNEKEMTKIKKGLFLRRGGNREIS